MNLCPPPKMSLKHYRLQFQPVHRYVQRCSLQTFTSDDSQHVHECFFRCDYLCRTAPKRLDTLHLGMDSTDLHVHEHYSSWSLRSVPRTRYCFYRVTRSFTAPIYWFALSLSFVISNSLLHVFFLLFAHCFCPFRTQPN